MKKPAVVIVFLVLVLMGGLYWYKNNIVTGPLTATLVEESDSGINGQATLSNLDSKVVAEINLSNEASGLATIHEGTCADLGSAIHTLSAVTNGTSSTQLDTTLSALFRNRPLAVNITKSEFEPLDRVSCGTIK